MSLDEEDFVSRHHQNRRRTQDNSISKQILLHLKINWYKKPGFIKY